MEIEATQAIPLSDYDEDDETDEETEQDKHPVSTQLKLMTCQYALSWYTNNRVSSSSYIELHIDFDIFRLYN